MSSESGTVEGEFWQIDTPEQRVKGWLSLAGPDEPTLETLGRIFDERSHVVTVSPTGGVTVTQSGDPEDLIADFEPRTILGELADGRSVSLIDAQGHKKDGGFFSLEYRQVFKARYVVMDEHVNGAEQRFHSVRFRVQGPYWRGPEQDEASTSDGGHLVMRKEDGHQLFEFIPSSALTLREIGNRVLNPITTLTSLATKNDAVDCDLEVRINADGAWRQAHRERGMAEAGSHPLLDTIHLTAERFATWIDLRKRTDGLDAAVLDELRGAAIQTQVLTLGSVAEGLHRRLFDEKKRIPSLSPGKTEKLRRAARVAGLELLNDGAFTDNDRAEFADMIQEAFGHINDQTFRRRMADLLQQAQDSIPEIAAPFADWPTAVAYARNTLAHQGTNQDVDQTEQFIDLLIALSYSIAWILRTNLLRRAGFDNATLREAYRLSSAYNHHITNCRRALANGPYGAVEQ